MMAGLAALYGQQPESLKSLYSQDPKYQLAQQALQSGMSTAPAQGGWGEGLARIFQGALGGKLAADAKSEINKSESAKSQSLADAIALGRDQPASTQTYGDGTTINWDERKGSKQNMIDALSSNPQTQTIGMGLQGAMMDAEMSNAQELAKLKLANELKRTEPITPYQEEQLKLDREKAAKTSNGISYTMPDGTQIQIGGSGGKLSEAQGVASSRSTLINDGLKQLEQNISSPNVSPLRSAVAETVSKAGPLGDLAATKLRTDEEALTSAGKDATLEGLASAVTGAGVTNDQFTRFTNMLPKPADSENVKQQKFDNAYSFLLNQTNIAGPIADQIKQRIVERNQGKANPVGTVGAAGSSTTPDPMAAAKAAGYSDEEIQQYLQGRK